MFPTLYSCVGRGASGLAGGAAFGLGLGFKRSASSAATFFACSRKALMPRAAQERGLDDLLA